LTDLWAIEGELTYKPEGFGEKAIVAWSAGKDDDRAETLSIAPPPPTTPVVQPEMLQGS